MAAPAKTPAAANPEAPPLSMLCVRMPPDLIDDTEFWVRLGPMGARRRLAPGDHVDPGHELVSHFPTHFQPSGERADVVVLSSPTPEVLRQREQERARLLPRFGEVRQVLCLNCQETSPASPPIEPEVQALDVASGLANAEGDLIERRRVEFHSFAQQRRRLDAIAEANRIAAEFRQQHSQCDPSRELHPLPEPPEFDPSQPLPIWSGPISLGRH